MKTKMNYLAPCAAALALAMAGCNEGGSGDGDGAGAGGDGGKGDGYPLEVCIVSGEELGSMGKPVDYDHEGTLVKFCCKSCIPDFEEDPDRYLEKLKAAQP